MGSNELEEKFAAIVGSVAAGLKPLGFRKQGQRFRRDIDGNVSLVEFQRSAASDQHMIKFTLNVGVISGRLLNAWDPDSNLEKVGSSEAHLRERIGFFLHPPTDHWWALKSGTDTQVIAADVTSLVVRAAVPYLNKHGTDESLLALWHTGKSPGLTEGQRQLYVALLAMDRMSAVGRTPTGSFAAGRTHRRTFAAPFGLASSGHSFMPIQ